MNYINTKSISAILDQFGGKGKYKRDEHNIEYLVFLDIYDLGKVLTIDIKHRKEDYAPFIEARLANKKGRIIQINEYEILFDGTELYLHSIWKINEEIQYIDEKVAYIGKAKVTPRAELEKHIKKLVQENNLLREQNDRLLQQAEENYLNSYTYRQMKEKVDFLESMIRGLELRLQTEKRQLLQHTTDVQQLYKDNKEILAHYGDDEYFIGITNTWKDAYEFEQLQKENNRLKSIVESNKIIQQELQKQIDNAINTKLSKIEEKIQEERNDRIGAQKKRGPKPKISDEQRQLILALNQKGYSIREIAREMDCSVGSVHRIIKEAYPNG